VLAGDHLYMSNRNADVFALEAGPKFKLLGVEPMNASLAVSDGDILIRTARNL
jgi:hypothetical protein